jgi:hypothetical protein
MLQGVSVLSSCGIVPEVQYLGPHVHDVRSRSLRIMLGLTLPLMPRSLTFGKRVLGHPEGTRDKEGLMK